MSGHEESEAHPTLPLPGKTWIQNQSTPVWNLSGDLVVVGVAKMDVRGGAAGAVRSKYSSGVEDWGMVAWQLDVSVVVGLRFCSSAQTWSPSRENQIKLQPGFGLRCHPHHCQASCRTRHHGSKDQKTRHGHFLLNHVRLAFHSQLTPFLRVHLFKIQSVHDDRISAESTFKPMGPHRPHSDGQRRKSDFVRC